MDVFSNMDSTALIHQLLTLKIGTVLSSMLLANLYVHELLQNLQRLRIQSLRISKSGSGT